MGQIGSKGMMKSKVVGAAVCLVLSVAVVWALPPKPVAITESLVAPHLQFLASDITQGRRTGEKGNEIAARYIAEQFRRLGLTPVGTSRQKDASAKMNGSGYFQPWTFVAGSKRGKTNALEVTVNGRAQGCRVGKDFEPSNVSSTGAAEGEVIFVGYGNRSNSRDDYEGVDPKGKVALALSSPEQPQRQGRFRGFDVMRKVQAARDAGVAALVVALANDQQKPTFDPNSRASDAGLPVVVVRRALAAGWLKAAGKDLAAIEKDLTDKPSAFAMGMQARVRTEVAKREEVSANIIGLLPGSDAQLAKQYVVIGAHMDHLGHGGAGSLAGGASAIHYGADDNASGTAGVMALAEYFASQPVRPKRSLLFMAYSGEELGLLGSAHYAKSPVFPLENTVAMLNMDMIGRMKDNKLSVIGVGTSPVWNRILDEVNKGASFQMARSNSGFGGSDHQSFYRARVPVLFFFTGTHPDYHRPSDTFDKINMWDETRVVQMVAAIAERVGNDPERPAYAEMQASRSSGAAGPRRMTASIGIMPEYSAEAVGVPVGGLRAGGPAEKAGIRVGDVVVKLAGKSVRNIEEYMAVLADKKPGDAVEVVVRRAGQELTLTLTLAESVR